MTDALVAEITSRVLERIAALDPRKVVVGISNRHVHLCDADFKTLFGYDAPKANAKPEPTPQPEQARPASGSAQKSAPAPDPKPGATPKNPAETTKAPRTSTTRRKQS